MNRLAVGLAVGAGYLLGRTKKAKLAFAVGTMVAGRRLQLSPGALVGAVTRQLEDNPQFKEIGDQLKQDLRGVGKAATGSLLDRQLEGLADRLHDRTLDVRDRLSGVTPDTDGVPGADEAPDQADETSDKAAETSDKAKGAGKSAGGTAKAGARKTGSATKKATSAARGERKTGPSRKTQGSRGTDGARGSQQRGTGTQRRTAKKATRTRGGSDD
ncbi:DNA primase [Streptomyces flavofungini]|uniref:DNA primase n=1 Tax=Streptomyces flavofungini TaxID=68200 RepID=UPI0025AF0D8A|nr:DNA primase [Streptomyces flavofungini]WJV45275.1 DNA primase [Streptomyces flavofungini]